MYGRRNNIKHLKKLRVQHEYRTQELEYQWLDAKRRLEALKSVVDFQSSASSCRNTPSQAIMYIKSPKPVSKVSFGAPSSRDQGYKTGYDCDPSPCSRTISTVSFGRPNCRGQRRQIVYDSSPCQIRAPVIMDNDCYPCSSENKSYDRQSSYQEEQRRPWTSPALPACRRGSTESSASFDSYDFETLNRLTELVKWTKETEKRIAVLDQVEGVILASLTGRPAPPKSYEKRPKTRSSSDSDRDGAADVVDVTEVFDKDDAGPSVVVDDGSPEGQQQCIQEIEGTVIEEMPAEEMTADETLAEETPAEETLAEETPAEETPADEMPAEEIPAEEMPTGEMSVAEEAPAEEASAEEASAEEASAEETNAEEAPAEENDVPDTEVTDGEETAVEESAVEEFDDEGTPAEETADTEPAEPPNNDEEGVPEEEGKQLNKMLTMKHNIDLVVDHFITCDVNCVPGEEYDKINQDLEELIRIFDEVHEETETEEDVECVDGSALPKFSCCPGCICTPPKDPEPAAVE